MGCGRERQAASPGGPPPAPGAPPAPAAPPGHPPYAAPARPSPLGAFLTRTAKGDWVAALKVAGWPTLVLLVLACLLGIFSSDDTDEAGLGWGTRMRIALALLLQSVGGGVSFSGNAGASLGSFGEGLAGEASLSLVPLVATAVWAGALVIAARRGGPATPVPEAVVPGALPQSAVLEKILRIAALCGAGTFLLGLLAQPSYGGVELSSSPWLALLWSFLLAAVVSGAVLARTEARAWLATRPAWRTATGALRSALFALFVVLSVSAVVTFVTLLATADDLDGGQVLGTLVLLPNLGALALALAWGAPLNAEWNLPDMPFLGSGRESLGYSELGEVSGGWTVFGVIVGAVVCALLVGHLVVRRSADRREALLAAGFFVVALVCVVLVAGASVSATFHEGSDSGGPGYGGGYGASGPSIGAHAELTAGLAETLLFALLWTFGAVLLVPYLLMIVGRGGPTAPTAPHGGPAAAPGYGYPPTGAGYGPPATGTPDAPAAPAAPADPATPAAPAENAAAPSAPPPASATPPTPTAPDLPAVQLRHAPPPGSTPAFTPAFTPAPGDEPRPPRRGAVKWVALALAAFLVGGGGTAGALYFKNRQDDTGDKADKPAAVTSERPRDDRRPSASPSASATPTGGPSGSPAADPTAGTPSPGAPLPEGFVRQQDPKGFSLGVMRGWKRSQKGTQIDYKAPAGKSYLRIGVIPGAPQSSYENFSTLEKGARKRTNYQRTELTQNTFRNSAGARWEFTYVNDETGNTMHAIDQAYVAADGTEYSIYYECVDSLYDPVEDQVFSTALNTWSVGGESQ